MHRTGRGATLPGGRQGCNPTRGQVPSFLTRVMRGGTEPHEGAKEVFFYLNKTEQVPPSSLLSPSAPVSPPPLLPHHTGQASPPPFTLHTLSSGKMSAMAVAEPVEVGAKFIMPDLSRQGEAGGRQGGGREGGRPDQD